MTRWNAPRSTAGLVLLLGLFFTSPTPGTAADGRDFAGTYELSNVTDQGDAMLLTFTARVFNYSDADVSGTVVLEHSGPIPGQPYWSLPGTSIANRGSVRLSCSVTIPRAEYEGWRQGRRPNLHVDTTDADGHTIRRPVELSPGAVGEGN